MTENIHTPVVSALAVCRTERGIAGAETVTASLVSVGIKMSEVRVLGRARCYRWLWFGLAAVGGLEHAGSSTDFASGCLDQSMQAFAVVRQTHQLPFATDLLQASQREPSEAHHLLDDPEHRLDRLLAQAV